MEGEYYSLDNIHRRRKRQEGAGTGSSLEEGGDRGRMLIEQVQEKFMLDVSEEVAIKQFEVLLNDTSYLTVVFDRIHNW